MRDGIFPADANWYSEKAARFSKMVKAEDGGGL